MTTTLLLTTDYIATTKSWQGRKNSYSYGGHQVQNIFIDQNIVYFRNSFGNISITDIGNSGYGTPFPLFTPGGTGLKTIGPSSKVTLGNSQLQTIDKSISEIQTSDVTIQGMGQISHPTQTFNSDHPTNTYWDYWFEFD